MPVGELIGNIFGGGSPGEVQTSGFFPRGLGQKLGRQYGRFLLERLRTPVEQSQAYTMGSSLIRDALSRSAGATRERLSGTALGQGWLDSGQFTSSLLDIERASGASEIQGLTNLFLELEARRTSEILPYLQTGASEFASVERTNAQIASQTRGQNLSFMSQLLSSGGFGGMNASDAISMLFRAIQSMDDGGGEWTLPDVGIM